MRLFKNFAFGRFALAFEESTRNLPGCIEIFTVVDREWEEIKPFPGLLWLRMP